MTKLLFQNYMTTTVKPGESKQLMELVSGGMDLSGRELSWWHLPVHELYHVTPRHATLHPGGAGAALPLPAEPVPAEEAATCRGTGGPGGHTGAWHHTIP